MNKKLTNPSILVKITGFFLLALSVFAQAATTTTTVVPPQVPSTTNTTIVVAAQAPLLPPSTGAVLPRQGPGPNRPPSGTDSTTVTATTPPFGIQNKLVWKVLLLVYKKINFSYTDSNAQRIKHNGTLSNESITNALQSFKQFPALAYEYSGKETVIIYDIIHIDRFITKLAKYRSGYIADRDSISQDIMQEFITPGRYDSVIVHWPKELDNGDKLPNGGALATTSSIIKPYTFSEVSSFFRARPDTPAWVVSEIGEIWLHEWLHGASHFYTDKGYILPSGTDDKGKIIVKDADGGGGHNYPDPRNPSQIDPNYPGWSKYYRDLMTQNVSDLPSFFPDTTPNENYPQDEKTGISQQAWRCSTLLGNNKKQVFVDYFYKNTTANYQKTGSVAWKDKPDDNWDVDPLNWKYYQTIQLGTSTISSNNEMYAPASFDGNFTITGHVRIPNNNIGIYDSVALALKDESRQVKYWASLVYGTSLNQKNTMSILRNDQWGDLAAINMDAGKWYTIKVHVDYSTSLITMKAWSELENEPTQWQTSIDLDFGAKISHIGFRHYGQSVTLDDLVAVSDGGTEALCLPLTITPDPNGIVASEPFSIFCGKNGNARSCYSEFENNTAVTLTATPNNGYVIDAWNGDCSFSGNSNTCVLNMSFPRSTAPKNATVRFKQVVSAPVLSSFSINNGTSSTASRTVTLNNSASGRPTQYMASESSSFSGASWQTYSSAPNFVLSGGNGTKTVYFKVQNSGGLSSIISDSITLNEVVAPILSSISINNGASSTASRTVTLNNSASGSPTQYMASESSSFSGASWQTYSSAPSFVLSSGNGTKTVYFKVQNSTGPSSINSDSITLNEVIAPVLSSISINNGASSTASRTITLNNGTANSPTQYMASESSSFSGASWQTYSSAPSFVLSGGNGTKTVYFKVQNSAGLSSIISDSITLNEPDNKPYFSGASLSSSVTRPNKIYFSGSAYDDKGLSIVTMMVNGSKGNNLTAFTTNVSGTSINLGGHYFDSNNSNYAGKIGSYTVGLWIKDTAGQATLQSFTVQVK